MKFWHGVVGAEASVSALATERRDESRPSVGNALMIEMKLNTIQDVLQQVEQICDATEGVHLSARTIHGYHRAAGHLDHARGQYNRVREQYPCATGILMTDEKNQQRRRDE